MLKLKKRIDGYLKYPLMWVMLLWAFTMPGHEVRVYNVLFHALAGKPVTDISKAQAEISRAETYPDFAYQEASPPPPFAGKIKLQLPGPVSGNLSFYQAKVNHFSTPSGSTYQATALKDQLLIALLPNAP